MAIGPTVHARVLGVKLAALRETAKIKQKAAADFAGLSQGQLSQIEAGKAVIRKNDLPVLARYYGANQETIDELDQYRAGASRHGWWYVYKLSSQYDLYVGLEAGATSVRAMELQLIPGLLQTEQYARKLHTLRGKYTPEEVDQRVAVRMQRQKRLTDSTPLQLVVILDEAALIRCAREPTIGVAQLESLMARADLPNVDIRVLTLDTGLHVGTAGAFSILSFPDGILPDVVHQEYVVGGHVIDDQTVVSQLDTLFSKLHRLTLGASESLTLISELAKQAR